jgi:hypothetical protein
MTPEQQAPRELQPCQLGNTEALFPSRDRSQKKIVVSRCMQRDCICPVLLSPRTPSPLTEVTQAGTSPTL